MKWPWQQYDPPADGLAIATPPPDPATLHTCRCGHTVGLLDEHWLTITSTRDGTQQARVCSPRCAVLWLEDTYRPRHLEVVL